MKNFEQVYIKMEPTIHKVIFKSNVYKNFEEFKQIAAIALWEAWKTYDSSKCEFEPYAYLRMRYAILDELKKRQAYSKRLIATDEDKLHFYLEQATEYNLFIHTDERIELVMNGCSQQERELLSSLFIEQKKSSEIAIELGVSVEVIKKRKQRLIKKLKTL